MKEMKTKEILQQCNIQLQYLNDRFGEMSTTKSLMARIEHHINELDASQFQQEWIPVEVRLPEITMRTSSDWVLTFDKSISRIDKAFYSTVTGWQAEHGEPMNVSHWMPLPTPPLPQPYNPKQP